MFIFYDMNRPQLRDQYPKPTYRIANIKFMPRYNIQIIILPYIYIHYIGAVFKFSATADDFFIVMSIN